MTTSFPIGSSVLLQNLIKGAHLNNKKGIVKSNPTNDGSGSTRQEVYIFEAQKSLSIKPANMRYEPRSLGSLSISEMKGIMLMIEKKEEGEEPMEWKGMDKEEMRKIVKEKIDTNDPEEIAELVAKANEPKPKDVPSSSNGSSSGSGTNGSFNGSQLRQGAEKMSQMTPEDLRRQAATMKAMGPAALRAMNPQMARMTDAQINMAISQMEAVANNPTQLKMAADQMKNMSESDLKQAVEQSPLMGSTAQQSAPSSASSSTASAATTSTTTTPTINNISKSQFQQATAQMSTMTPTQLRQQAAMLRSMPKSTLRQTNPQMATMTDAQIDMSILQLEQMAENPEMVKMAADQMRNMSEEDYESMKKMMGGGGLGGAAIGSSAAATPSSSTATTKTTANGNNNNATAPSPQDFQSKMMESLLSNPEQLNSMVKTMKQNPEMMKSMMASNAQSDAQKEQISKAIDSFSQMDDVQLERYLKVANGVQRVAKPLLGVFKKTKETLGVSAKTLVILINLGTLVFLVGLGRWWRLRNGGDEDGGSLEDVLVEEPPEIVAGYGDSEF